MRAWRVPCITRAPSTIPYFHPGMKWEEYIMKRIILFPVFMAILLLMGCESSDEGDLGSGTVMIQAFDAPFQGDVEHIFLHILEVSVHKAVADSGSDTTASWIVLSDADTTIDFLELVNGQVATLLEEELEAGHYSQLRLLLGDSSAIVVDGVSHELKVPSGSQSGVKLRLGFSVDPDEIVEIYLDFDASRSINKHPNQDRYSMRPTFKVFRSVVSGTIAGTVLDTSGAGLDDVVVNAIAGEDTTTTLTDADGGYQFILLAGDYELSADAFELTADTIYTAVNLTSGSNLTGYDFTME